MSEVFRCAVCGEQVPWSLKHTCSKPEAPTEIDPQIKEMKRLTDEYIAKAQAPGARVWTVAGFKEYLDLHRRNYEDDDLWGPDENKCSDEFSRFVELEQFFQRIDNKGELIAAYEALERELAQYKIDLEIADARTNECKGDLACALTDLSDARAELAGLQKIYTTAIEREKSTNAKNAALVEALEFYASGQHAISEFNDGGRAREALKKYGGGE